MLRSFRIVDISYALSLLVGAALLFWVQPMMARAILPSLGGAPAVWITSLLWFQTMLLAGYGLSHLLARAPATVLRVVTLGLLLICLWGMPLTADLPRILPEDYANPTLWVLTQLTVTLGPPFLLLSCTATLIQLAYARMHSHQSSPYWLYALSNTGSLLGLLGFVVVIEPIFGVHQQFDWWSQLFWLYGAALALSILITPLGKKQAEAKATQPETPAPRMSDYGWWILLGFVPTSLMLSVTQHITTDIAPVPLFWVLPLTLFLLSYIWAFAEKWPFPMENLLNLQPVLILPLLVIFSLSQAQAGAMPMLLWELAGFFVCALIAQRRLYESRPDTRHLTGFYLAMSLGGALAGLLSAVIAPMLFDHHAEYGIVLALALIIRPKDDTRTPWWKELMPGLLVLVIGLPVTVFLIHTIPDPFVKTLWMMACFLLIKLCFELRTRPIAMAVTFYAVLMIGQSMTDFHPHVVLRERNFFGALKVKENEGVSRRLYNGTTLHGRQSLEPALTQVPMTYYHPQGPLGDIARIATQSPTSLRVLVTGLGIGSASCLFREQDRVTYYEINPAVVAIAQNTELFTFLSDCPAKSDVRIGDGRLLLGGELDAQYDLIILDAFNSDAIPVHLLTQEALLAHMDKLDSDGMLAVHISNRFIQLDKMLMQTTASLPYQLYRRLDMAGNKEGDAAPGRYASEWVIVSRGPIDALDADANWLRLTHKDDARSPWTDDHTPILPYLKLW